MPASPIPGLDDAQALEYRQAVRRDARLTVAMGRLGALRFPDGEAAGAAVEALELLREHRAELRAQLERARAPIAAALNEAEAERLERLGYPENAAALRRSSSSCSTMRERRAPVRVPDPGRGLSTTEGAELERQELARRRREAGR